MEGVVITRFINRQLNLTLALLWLRRLVAYLLLCKPGFAPEPVHVGFMVAKVHWDRVFSEFFGFPLSVLFHRYSIFIYHVGDEQ
jgi:hypothetical protein